MRKSPRLLGVLFPVLMVLAGCATAPDSEEKLSLLEHNVVTVDLADGTETRLFVRSSLNEHSRAGVHFMMADDWDAAIRELNLAVAEQGRDHRSFFALGLAREKAQQLAGAKEAYETAVKQSRGKDVIYTGSLKRVKEKIAQQQPVEW